MPIFKIAIKSKRLKANENENFQIRKIFWITFQARATKIRFSPNLLQCRYEQIENIMALSYICGTCCLKLKEILCTTLFVLLVGCS